MSFACACIPHYGCGRGSLENHSTISQRYVKWDISPNRLGDHLFLSAFDSPVRKENKTPKNADARSANCVNEFQKTQLSFFSVLHAAGLYMFPMEKPGSP